MCGCVCSVDGWEREYSMRRCGVLKATVSSDTAILRHMLHATYYCSYIFHTDTQRYTPRHVLQEAQDVLLLTTSVIISCRVRKLNAWWNEIVKRVISVRNYFNLISGSVNIECVNSNVAVNLASHPSLQTIVMSRLLAQSTTNIFSL